MARGRPSKKQQLLDTARWVFAENGYQGTSIDLVVQKAGVSKPTVYNNFPTKQALLQALLTQLIDELEVARAEILTESTDALKAVFSVYINLAAQQEYLMMYRILSGEQYKLDETTRAQIQAFDQRLHDDCTFVLEKAEGVMPVLVLMFCRDQVLGQALMTLSGVKKYTLEQLERQFYALTAT